MLSTPEPVRAMLDAFEGASVVAIENAQLKDWPTDAQLKRAREGELWISKDLACLFVDEKEFQIGRDFNQRRYSKRRK